MATPLHGAEHTIAIGEEALGSIKRYGTSAAPPAYEIWFTHVAGYNPALSHAVDTCLRQSGTITDGELDAIHAQYLSPLRLTDQVDRAGASLGEEIDELVALLETAFGTADGFGKALSGAIRQLAAGPGTREDVRSLLEGVVHAIQGMQQSNRLMQEKLAASRQKVGSLQALLSAARAESLTDPLTSLANRKALDSCLERLLPPAAPQGEPFSLLLVDIDHFKRINDNYGHPMGDQVLRLVALAIRQSLRDGDLPARYGGEEFAVVLPGLQLAEARVIAERIRNAVMSREMVKRSTGETLGRLTVSIGAATWTTGDAAALIERADACLYAAKRNGRNRVVDETEEALLQDIAAA